MSRPNGGGGIAGGGGGGGGTGPSGASVVRNPPAPPMPSSLTDAAATGVGDIEGRQHPERTSSDPLVDKLRQARATDRDVKEALQRLVQAMDAQLSNDCVAEVQDRFRSSATLRDSLESEIRRSAELQADKMQLQTQMEAHSRRIAELQEGAEDRVADLRDRLSQRDQEIIALKRERDTHKKETTAQIKLLREEGETWRSQAETARAKMESLEAELGELHDAMASLHGEMGAVQRELENTAENERNARRQCDALQEEVEQHRSRVEQAEASVHELEAQLHAARTAAEQSRATLQEVNATSVSQVEELKNEGIELQSQVSALETKLSASESTNQELNNMLSTMQAQEAALKQRFAEVQIECNEATGRAALFEEQLAATRKELDITRDQLEQTERDRVVSLNEATQLRNKLNTHQDQSRSQSNALQRAEEDMRDIQVELTQRSADVDRLKHMVATHESEKAVLEQQLKDALETKGERDTEVNELRSEKDALQREIGQLKEETQAYERELADARRHKEELNEAAKSNQRESANRIVEFSQRNARLASEVTSLREQLKTVQAEREAAKQQHAAVQSEQQGLMAEKDRLKNRVGALEDDLEEVRAKHEAISDDLTESRNLLATFNEAAKRRETDLRREQAAEIERLKQSVAASAEDRIAETEAQKAQLQASMEDTIARTRQSLQTQLDDLRKSKAHEIADARQKATAVVRAMEALQQDLQAEESRNEALTEELRKLRESYAADTGPGEATGLTMPELEEEVKALRSRNTMLVEQIAVEKNNLREQLDRALEDKRTAEHTVETLREEAQEREQSSSASGKQLRKQEEQLAQLSNALEEARAELQKSKRVADDAATRQSAALRSKEGEIERLIRRNQVLSDAVTRLTYGGEGDVREADGLLTGQDAIAAAAADDVLGDSGVPVAPYDSSAVATTGAQQEDDSPRQWGIASGSLPSAVLGAETNGRAGGAGGGDERKEGDRKEARHTKSAGTDTGGGDSNDMSMGMPYGAVGGRSSNGMNPGGADDSGGDEPGSRPISAPLHDAEVSLPTAANDPTGPNAATGVDTVRFPKFQRPASRDQDQRPQHMVNLRVADENNSMMLPPASHNTRNNVNAGGEEHVEDTVRRVQEALEKRAHKRRGGNKSPTQPTSGSGNAHQERKTELTELNLDTNVDPEHRTNPSTGVAALTSHSHRHPWSEGPISIQPSAAPSGQDADVDLFDGNREDEQDKLVQELYGDAGGMDSGSQPIVRRSHGQQQAPKLPRHKPRQAQQEQQTGGQDLATMSALDMMDGDSDDPGNDRGDSSDQGESSGSYPRRLRAQVGKGKKTNRAGATGTTTAASGGKGGHKKSARAGKAKKTRRRS